MTDSDVSDGNGTLYQALIDVECIVFQHTASSFLCTALRSPRAIPCLKQIN